MSEKCPYCNGLGVIPGQEDLFDFNSIYLEYPKKGPGKKRGLAKLQKICKSEKTFLEIKEALRKLLTLNREKQYYPGFDTFINNYEDYLEIPEPPKPNKPVFTQIITHPKYKISQQEAEERKRDIQNLLVSVMTETRLDLKDD